MLVNNTNVEKRLEGKYTKMFIMINPWSGILNNFYFIVYIVRIFCNGYLLLLKSGKKKKKMNRRKFKIRSGA